MGIFDGLLLLSDLDDTLLTTDKRISEENTRAIEYFKSEGGLFTFATGRVPIGAKLLLDYIRPNAPMVCFNGAAVYDFNDNKILWSRSLGTEAVKVVEYIDKMFDFVGIEICTADKIYFSKVNNVVMDHQKAEKLPDNFLDYHEVKEEWIKVLFMTEADRLHEIKEAITASPFTKDYSFVQSDPRFYELLPKGVSKGEGLLRLADLLGINRTHTIGIGDNENDIELVRNAGTGIAVENAVEEVKRVADFITVDNNSHAIDAVVNAIKKHEISTEK
ncbi:MAG: Cof-type HAD-IIB family hydrolase [Oscillospiraceae bacterium]|nr:Cof-type HAD-IIB family hydrolase [Oscillospiraceae bacterium]